MKIFKRDIQNKLIRKKMEIMTFSPAKDRVSIELELSLQAVIAHYENIKCVIYPCENNKAL